MLTTWALILSLPSVWAITGSGRPMQPSAPTMPA